MSRIAANPLLELADFEEMNIRLNRGRGPVAISGCLDSQRVHMMVEAGESCPWKLIITYEESRAKELYEDFRCFTDQVWLYPARDLLFYQADVHGNLLTRQRMQVLTHLMEESSGVVITTINALMEQLMPLKKLEEGVLEVSQGDDLNVQEFVKHLVEMGYERLPQVDMCGQFSVRGGIIDIFPMNLEQPCRIELWDTEVDSIRSFDPESQRSLEQMESLILYPAAEQVLSDEELEEGVKKILHSCDKYQSTLRKQMKTEAAFHITEVCREFCERIQEEKLRQGLEGFLQFFCQETVSLIQYFIPGKTAIFLDEPVRLKERAEVVELEFRESMTHRLEAGYLLPEQTDLLFEAKRILAELEGPRTVLVSALDQNLSWMKVKDHYHIQAANINSYQNLFAMMIEDMKKWQKEKYRVVLLTASRTRASRLVEQLLEYDLHAYTTTEEGYEVKPGEILVTYGTLHRGFVYHQIRYVVVTEGDLFGNAKKRKTRRRNSGEGKRLKSFAELSVGDYVVHENHGIGVYKGINKIEQEGIVKDYLTVEYADGGRLYLPATKLDVLQKYADADAPQPKLNKLSGEQWNKTRAKVKNAVKDMAKELVELYAARQDAKGYRYSADTEWQREFEELFPFDETDDQLDAIEAAKRDMESGRVMDRLICGDVGYGKTEIALRAAFKAVQDGKQVVYLVPTTVLAQQHYNTFVQRMRNYPVRIDQMSRFRTTTEIKKTLTDLKKGLVDIVIGTHRVLSKDVEFKDLGLLIIDEEQRFGVSHKEKIKQLKENVDVLTLTATPIPRTLHMSLTGIRDMSILEEPPVDRIPIQTYVMEYNEEMVREAINRELARQGQIYYVYNKVQDIADVASRISKLVPEAVVVYAHGQMREHELERIMLDFVNGDIDVLVSTTIIETGLDIPNANTIIIQGAERMGLSQLYQLRGRVGRSNRTAYAFLLYQKNKMLKEEAEKRLQAIREFTELGSGVKIAMRDLEIRGAGNVLGAEQHGHMEAVGYDLYCKLLSQAVDVLRGRHTEEDDFHTTVECEIDAYIPQNYIRNEHQKIDIYKRIATIETEDEYMDMQDELIDRFGDIPEPVMNLLKVAFVKALGYQCFLTEIQITRPEIRMNVFPKARYQTEKIQEVLAGFAGALRILPGNPPRFLYQEHNLKNRNLITMLTQTETILKELKKLTVN